MERYRHDARRVEAGRAAEVLEARKLTEPIGVVCSLAEQARMSSMVEGSNLVVVVEPARRPTAFNSSGLRLLNLIRRRNGFFVCVYDRGFAFPRYREHLATETAATERAEQLRAALASAGRVPKQSVWRRL